MKNNPLIPHDTIKLRVPVSLCACGRKYIPTPLRPNGCPTCYRLNVIDYKEPISAVKGNGKECVFCKASLTGTKRLYCSGKCELKVKYRKYKSNNTPE